MIVDTPQLDLAIVDYSNGPFYPGVIYEEPTWFGPYQFGDSLFLAGHIGYYDDTHIEPDDEIFWCVYESTDNGLTWAKTAANSGNIYGIAGLGMVGNNATHVTERFGVVHAWQLKEFPNGNYDLDAYNEWEYQTYDLATRTYGAQRVIHVPDHPWTPAGPNVVPGDPLDLFVLSDGSVVATMCNSSSSAAPEVSTILNEDIAPIGVYTSEAVQATATGYLTFTVYSGGDGVGIMDTMIQSSDDLITWVDHYAFPQMISGVFDTQTRGEPFLFERIDGRYYRAVVTLQVDSRTFHVIASTPQISHRAFFGFGKIVGNDLVDFDVAEVPAPGIGPDGYYGGYRWWSGLVTSDDVLHFVGISGKYLSRPYDRYQCITYSNGTASVVEDFTSKMPAALYDFDCSGGAAIIGDDIYVAVSLFINAGINDSQPGSEILPYMVKISNASTTPVVSVINVDPVINATRCWAIANGTDLYYVAPEWVDWPVGAKNIVYWKSLDGGSTWEEPHQVYDLYLDPVMQALQNPLDLYLLWYYGQSMSLVTYGGGTYIGVSMGLSMRHRGMWSIPTYLPISLTPGLGNITVLVEDVLNMVDVMKSYFYNKPVGPPGGGGGNPEGDMGVVSGWCANWKNPNDEHKELDWI